ncbi:16S rRNA (cytidine1402-2'-O)-methyltransferase [Evansella caseinilytica]|uniref:Ribosomal RNA small subunit methyltransferase I n=1 Tax=Evansella caseinilytica TaxID=1503961 RepID=A0A1H3UVW4_9BACI|nr:16S rRNA (cytidine(1402)-2'-O)-methyltransferase [Evansella caseinilytica]SDZ66564.1 16S rRNA (cytidine1402-2'-O)-methyltransferase [Evansella caseinilytica]
MYIQKSFRDEQATGGCLYLVPTPIGNLQDMTYRAVEILKTADVIAAEDTRHTKKLCHVFAIDTPLISYHEHNKREREEELVQRVKDGQVIALVSDAGMPAISDPGADLVARFSAEELPVIALPGANAALTALITSSLSTEQFTFLGFPERRKNERVSLLEEWQYHPGTMIFYEAPHRLKETLKDMLEVFGDRSMALCRELTKQYETIVRGTISEIGGHVEEEGIKGECVLVISGATQEEQEQQKTVPAWWEQLSVIEHVDAHIEKGMSPKDAVKETAKERQLKKRDVYRMYHVD